MTQTRRLPTLAQRLVVHVVTALVLGWLIASFGIVWVAAHFMQRAYDRGLVEDALLVAERVIADPANSSGVALKLSASELRAVLFDTTESIFFLVRTESGQFVAGHRGLAERPESDDILPKFAEKSFDGSNVRTATIRKPGTVPVHVTVGQTTTGRDSMLVQLTAATIAPLIILLAVLGFGVQRLVAADLAPLVQLERDLLQRDARDLSPVQVQSRVRDFVRLGDSFNALLATIRRAVVAQREFAGNIAHELRTPLSGIRALAEFGLNDGRQAVMQEQLAEIIRTQDKASRLVDQLLALAFAEEVSGTLKRESVRLDTVVRESMLRFIARADELGIDLGASGLDSPAEVLGNSALIEGIVNNLLDNACRHAFGVSRAQSPSQVTVSIDSIAATGTEGAKLMLTVSDNGIGLPDLRRSEVLQRWRRSSREPMLREGAGLGLAIVSEYARLLGARLALEPGPQGLGLAVRVTFDRAA